MHIYIYMYACENHLFERTVPNPKTICKSKLNLAMSERVCFHWTLIRLI